LAFLLAVAWMMPPTTPKAAEAHPAIPHRASTSQPATTAMAVTDASFDVPPPPPPPPVIEENAGRSAQPASRARASSGRSQDDQSAASPFAPAREGDLYAYLDPQKEYDRGYRWAERRQAEDSRECRRWADTPAEDGCLAFLQDRHEQGDEDEERDDE